MGRLGNQLFQVAFLVSFAERYGVDYALPEWDYAPFFAYDFKIDPNLASRRFDKVVREPSSAYCEDFFIRLLPDIRKGDVDIETGYFQSCRYFTKQDVLRIFKSQIELEFDTRDWVAISVRRGDFLKHALYVDIEAHTYRELLSRYFPHHKVLVCSDDFAYCRSEFIGPQYEFCEGYEAVEQLMLFRLFENFILSNSTFSFWGPMLSTKVKKVFYPRYMFTDLERCALFNRDYWPHTREYIPYDNPINKPLIVGYSQYDSARFDTP